MPIHGMGVTSLSWTDDGNHILMSGSTAFSVMDFEDSRFATKTAITSGENSQ